MLWISFRQDRKISKRALKAISTPGVRLFVSVVSIWEILIKRHAGKVWTSEKPDDIITRIESQTAWQILSLDVVHFHALNAIDAFTDHTDPFDRLLIAQASAERLSIVTADARFARYSVSVVW